jgi:hypothetical protein
MTYIKIGWQINKLLIEGLVSTFKQIDNKINN